MEDRLLNLWETSDFFLCIESLLLTFYKFEALLEYKTFCRSSVDGNCSVCRTFSVNVLWIDDLL